MKENLFVKQQYSEDRLINAIKFFKLFKKSRKELYWSLYFADMSCFYETGAPITGSVYYKTSTCPIPRNIVCFKNDYIVDFSHFSRRQIKILQRILCDCDNLPGVVAFNKTSLKEEIIYLDCFSDSKEKEEMKLIILERSLI